MQIEVKKRRPRRRKWRKWREGEPPRGMNIVPNLFTTANLFCGFFGIISSINGHFSMAAVAVFFATVFDILDGKVARLTHATSKFGVEYDSLTDLVSFGVGPALLMYLWALKPFGRLGWLACFVFVACGALRLARFNVQVDTASKRYFVGLPIPGAAIMVATTVLFLHEWRVEATFALNVTLLVATSLFALLMVSTVPFMAFKDVEVVKGKPLPVILAGILLVSIVAIEPATMLFVMAVIYLISGPVIYVGRRYRGTPTTQTTQTDSSEKPREESSTE